MEPAFWHQRWSENRIGFHQQEFNAHLTDLWSALDVRLGEGVFVPLCGKSLDLLWLAEQGYQVLGVELSATACESFFTENARPFQVENRGPFVAYRDSSITLLAGDFFRLTAECLSDVRGVYDRAALIALPPGMRIEYARHMAEILPPGCQTLLLGLTYDEEKMAGPPFSVAEGEVHKIFGSGFEVERLAEFLDIEAEEGLQARGLDRMSELVYLLTRN